MIKEFSITPNVEEFLRVGGKKLQKILKSQRNQASFNVAVEDIKSLVNPKVGWKRVPIKKIENGIVYLRNGLKIGGGPVSKVIKGAVEIVLAICTIGDLPEQKTREYMSGGKMFQSIILDSLSSWAVDSVRKQFCDWIKRELHMNEGYRTSIMLSPGESDWSVEDQAVIFKILEDEAHSIKVMLNESMVMVPIKSLTLLIGAGPNHLGKEDGTNCEFCLQKDRCRYSKMRIS